MTYKLVEAKSGNRLKTAAAASELKEKKKSCQSLVIVDFSP